MELDAFVALLREAHLRREAELEARFDRSLPFADGMFDRWERARRLDFGEGASIYDSAAVFGEVTVGANTWIGPQVLLDGSGGGLSIGSWCSISAGVQIYTHDTVLWALSGGEAAKRTGAVQIGDCCHIGALSVIGRGVSIGPRCVVGAHSFVNADVEPETVVAGAPARPIGRVDMSGEEPRMIFER